MKNIFLGLLFLIVVPCFTFSQGINIGEWRTHVSFADSRNIAETPEYYYCSSVLGLYRIMKADNSITVLSKATILNDKEIASLNYNKEANVLVILYTNGNIDLLFDDGTIKNISDIVRKNIVGNRTMNAVYSYNYKAYICTGFGIVVLDLKKMEIEDTYFIGENGSKLNINNVAVVSDTLYAATDVGLGKCALNNQFIANYANWDFYNNLSGTQQERCLSVVNFNNYLYVLFKNKLGYLNHNNLSELPHENFTYNLKLFANNKFLYVTYEDTMPDPQQGMAIFNTGNNIVKKIFDRNICYKVSEILPSDKLNDFWFSETYTGFTHYLNNTITKVMPNGPTKNGAFDFEENNGVLYVAGGGVDDYHYTFSINGFSIFDKESWSTYNRYNYPVMSDVFDVICMASKGSQVFGGSFGWGLVELKDNDVKVYKYGTALHGAIGDTTSYRIADMAFDSKNNLWMTNHGTPKPIVVKDASGKWFNFDSYNGKSYLTKLMIDKNDVLWTTDNTSYGIVLFSPGSDLNTTADDKYRFLTTGVGNGNLPSNEIKAIVSDNEGQVWVGTSKGIAVFYTADNILNQGDASQIIVSGADSIAAYLFESEVINDIKVDGANRKWVATTHGVWLVSADGLQTIYNFNENNSPLLSKNVISIGINSKTGEVFFGTDKGICSFKSTATGGAEEHFKNEVYAYPNPVPHNYTGIVAIKGLVSNAFVKITDINGQLIYSTQALGGQAIWDGKDLSGNKTDSGIYMVFSTDATGKESFVTKIMYLK